MRIRHDAQTQICICAAATNLKMGKINRTPTIHLRLTAICYADQFYIHKFSCSPFDFFFSFCVLFIIILTQVPILDGVDRIIVI